MRVGIVNDLPMAVEALRRVVESRTDYLVAWVARDGVEAVANAKRDPCDVVLMDLIMPNMDGVEATRRIMQDSPCPILVVTATVEGNYNKVYDAMGHGAIDAIDTPRLGPNGEPSGGQALLSKLSTVQRLTGANEPASINNLSSGSIANLSSFGPMVAIGASTGGPNALATILGGLPKEFDAAVVVVQHVDAAFSEGLAKWLNDRCQLEVRTVKVGEPPQRGKVLLAASNDHLVMSAGGRLKYTREPADTPYRPSVDAFFRSLANHWPLQSTAVLLTGMGRDGAKGLLRLREAKWETICQDEATSVVWGMPKAAIELKAAKHVLPVDKIADAIAASIRRSHA